jgi:rhamnose utilization protein RhaD (predicted bifunctional aldolase and dehydrogenase)/NAD(P)-dependent dehydrogenase (short-subunit alcohol dehydrogenase family)
MALPDAWGVTQACMAIKGSGWDMATMEPAGLPFVRLDPLLRLASLEHLSDEEMVNQLRLALLDHGAPTPSVECLLHAFLPFSFVDHTHSDAILALANQPDAAERCCAIFGTRLLCLPYVMPGFQLAKQVFNAWQAQGQNQLEGILLLHHGLFTFGPDARTSYLRMVDLVKLAEAHLLQAARTWILPPWSTVLPRQERALSLARLRGLLNRKGDTLVAHPLDEATTALLLSPPVREAFLRGPITPDHLIRIKGQPLYLGEEDLWQEQLAQFIAAYQGYLARGSTASGRPVPDLDPRPVLLLHERLGGYAFALSQKAAKVAADLAAHNATTIAAACALGDYQPVNEAEQYAMETWSLELAKLKRSQPPLAGKIVLISGAAGGIGEALVRLFSQMGAAIVTLDLPNRRQDMTALLRGAGAEGMHLEVDLTHPEEVAEAIVKAVLAFAGLDIVISNHGRAFTGQMAQSTSALQQSLSVNLMAHQHLAAAVFPFLREQATPASLLFNASKSAFNPGPDFGPYAVAKAGLIALMKQYAIEGGSFGLRANAVNADRVRTPLLDQNQLATRAAARGLDVDSYYRSNLLLRETTTVDVAHAFLCLATSAATTGCVLTVDGGNIAASPR